MAKKAMKKAPNRKKPNTSSYTEEERTETTQTVKVDKYAVGETNKKYAQKLDFAQLQQIMMQNVSKSQTKTYTQYTKERIQSYLQSPYANLDNIRAVSQFVYRLSMNYKKVIEYYAQQLIYSYNIVYNSSDWSNPPTKEEFMAEYQEVSSHLDYMGLQHLGTEIVSTVIRDGIYVGFTYDDGSAFMCTALDPQYCKIRSIGERNTWNVSFNATFFDKGNNKEYLYGVDENGENVWDKAFIEGYETYKSDGQDFKYFELPPERTIVMICGDDPLVPLPYFVNVLTSLLDLLDYEALIRSKTELQNYCLLVSKIPMLGGDEVNDFAVDLDLVQACQNMIDEITPDLVGSIYTPCDVETISFNNQNQIQDDNVYSEALDNFFSSIGVSQMLFNSNKGGSVGLAQSIHVDESLALEFLSRFEANIKRYVKYNVSENFDFYFHQITRFNQQEHINMLQSQATLGLPVKMDLATCNGRSPKQVINSTFMENALGITDLWMPLSSSYTQTDNGANSAGAPAADDSELTEEGQATRDGNKNEGTKAKG